MRWDPRSSIQRFNSNSTLRRFQITRKVSKVFFEINWRLSACNIDSSKFRLQSDIDNLIHVESKEIIQLFMLEVPFNIFISKFSNKGTSTCHVMLWRGSEGRGSMILMEFAWVTNFYLDVWVWSRTDNTAATLFLKILRIVLSNARKEGAEVGTVQPNRTESSESTVHICYRWGGHTVFQRNVIYGRSIIFRSEENFGRKCIKMEASLSLKDENLNNKEKYYEMSTWKFVWRNRRSKNHLARLLSCQEYLDGLFIVPFDGILRLSGYYVLLIHQWMF